jgi:hypothetical protein
VASKARITNRYSQFVDNVHNRAAGAMTQALVLGASEASVLTPIATSVLLNSQYKDVQREGQKVRGRVGYTAEYAAAVHDPDNPQRFRRASAEKEFLKKGFERAQPKITALLRGALAVGKVKP